MVIVHLSLLRFILDCKKITPINLGVFILWSGLVNYNIIHQKDLRNIAN